MLTRCNHAIQYTHALSNHAQCNTGVNTMQAIKTVTVYDLIPKSAVYLGSEHADGSMDEFVADGIADAIEPICFRDPEGSKHYFDIVG